MQVGGKGQGIKEVVRKDIRAGNGEGAGEEGTGKEERREGWQGGVRN